MRALSAILVVLDALVVVYFLIYALTNTALLITSIFRVREGLLRHSLHPSREGSERESFAPLLSLIVPAYNEDVTIVESIRSLLSLEYPHFEIVIVNDGSADRTVEVLREAFGFQRSDIDYHPHLGAAPVRAYYRASTENLPARLRSLVLVDKKNGGKADAINAGLNVATGAYVATMDADSLLIPDALSVAIEPILDDPNGVVASGSQVALSNGCTVRDGEVVELGIPKTWIGRFQVAEYMRSFSQNRTAMSELNALLILSGVFAIFQRQSLMAAGGFLTKYMRSRVGREYCGIGTDTVCEDMEVVVRLHRYLRERGEKGKIVFVATPTSWTEAPEIWENLGKQRSRWYRGLLEVLSIHRKMVFRRKYGLVGMFALPYQILFEAAAPVIEVTGYLVVPASIALGILSPVDCLAFVGVAIIFNFFLSSMSVLLAIWRVRTGRGRGAVLLDYRGAKNSIVLMFAGFLANFGYRQYLLAWQLRGLRDFLAGKKTWDKFARTGTGGGKAA